MALSSVTDEALRRLARSAWRGIEQGARRVEGAKRGPSGVAAEPVDPEFLPVHIMGLNLLAAADHARMMSAVITDTKLGPSAATIARGALENFARVHWISVGATGDEVKARALHVLRKDVQDSPWTSNFTSKHPERLPISRRRYIDVIEGHLGDLGVRGLNWSVSQAIADLSEKQWQHFDPRVPYSNLSSIAHGGLPGLAMLVADGQTLRLPRQEVINQVGVVLGVADKAVHALQRCPLPILPEQCVPEQWESLMVELNPTILKLKAEDRFFTPVMKKAKA